MIDIMDAARYFVFLSYGENKWSLTPLKLQKLLYLAQGWSFVWDNKPLFCDEFQAWQYGPVNYEIYDYFRAYGRSEIDESEGISYIEDNEAKETIEAVWNKYGMQGAFELVELTHEQCPWKDAYEQGRLISNHDIKEYFQSTY